MSSVHAVPRQGLGGRVINVCTHVHFSHFHTSGSIKTQSSHTHARADTTAKSSYLVSVTQHFLSPTVHQSGKRPPKTHTWKRNVFPTKGRKKKKKLFCTITLSDIVKKKNKKNNNTRLSTPVPILVKMAHFNAARQLTRQ